MSQYPRLYNSKRWKQLRKAQLEREPLCQMCIKLNDHKPATVVDHIQPHRGDEALFYHGRLQSLCKPCHDSHKQRQEKSGYLIGGDQQGIPLDPQHHWN